jgi:hypothetical protein
VVRGRARPIHPCQLTLTILQQISDKMVYRIFYIQQMVKYCDQKSTMTSNLGRKGYVLITSEQM